VPIEYQALKANSLEELAAFLETVDKNGFKPVAGHTFRTVDRDADSPPWFGKRSLVTIYEILVAREATNG
jgi:hypothetical protein